jgi:NAD-dependent dihydropyrimidine dehydrogenase PreA subunit
VLSRFQAKNDLEACDGCQDCIELCPADALALEKVPGNKRMKVQVEAAKCNGCGVCVFACAPRSLKIVIVPPLELRKPWVRAEARCE